MGKTIKTEKEIGKGKKRSFKERNELRVNPVWCKRCGICVAFCPKEALGKNPVDLPCWRDQDACNGCRLCESWCPDFALEIINEEERDNASKE